MDEENADEKKAATQLKKESEEFTEKLDVVLQGLKDSSRRTRERILSITKIQEAIMWLVADSSNP